MALVPILDSRQQHHINDGVSPPTLTITVTPHSRLSLHNYGTAPCWVIHDPFIFPISSYSSSLFLSEHTGGNAAVTRVEEGREAEVAVKDVVVMPIPVSNGTETEMGRQPKQGGKGMGIPRADHMYRIVMDNDNNNTSNTNNTDAAMDEDTNSHQKKGSSSPMTRQDIYHTPIRDVHPRSNNQVPPSPPYREDPHPHLHYDAVVALPLLGDGFPTDKAVKAAVDVRTMIPIYIIYIYRFLILYL
eukprot:gb/GECH01004141.1/.p1 GENE.gb/GECH01004141.1/~~gb/GECH01004141.1/.p1  ORF type:complete len:244 (+),score=32.97 gb/GECH01004141.1/:1-732(+)